MPISPEEAQKKWFDKYVKALPKMVRKAISPEATESYKKGIEAFTRGAVTSADLTDEASERADRMKGLTAEVMRELVARKTATGKTWYDEYVAGLKAT